MFALDRSQGAKIRDARARHGNELSLSRAPVGPAGSDASFETDAARAAVRRLVLLNVHSLLSPVLLARRYVLRMFDKVSSF